MPELDDVEVFIGTVHRLPAGENHNYLRVGVMYCPKCGDTRRMDLALKYRPPNAVPVPPILGILTCGECSTTFTAVLYAGPEAQALAVLPSTHGGLTTPHTPTAVSYYLDQAQRSHSVGANSAAVAMFRGALDQLFFEQGFKDGTCGKKLRDLEAAVKENKAPKWAYELDAEFLTVLKELGDGSIHPNDGDVSKQQVLDTELISKLKHTFQMLLFLVYELPLQKQERLAALKAAVLKK
jgi:hypothetical protein